MSRRELSILLALLLVPTVGQAQLGGLVKKATGRAAAAAGLQRSTDQPARMAGPEVTPQSVDRFLAGLKTEADLREWQVAERRRAEEQQAAAHVADSLYQKCMDDFPKTDPGAKELERLGQQASDAANKGDVATAMQLSQRMAPLQIGMLDRMKTACPQPSAAPAPAQARLTPEQQAMKEGNSNPSDGGANAAGMSPTDYAQFKELIYTYLRTPDRAGLSDNERQAANSRKAELSSGLRAVGFN
jgi:hypothetical protein